MIFFFFLVMLYSNFVINTFEKIPEAATECLDSNLGYLELLSNWILRRHMIV